MARVAVLIAVVVLHIALIAMFTVSRKLYPERHSEERNMAVVFLSRMPTGEPVQPSIPKIQANREADGDLAGSATIPASPSAIDNTAITAKLSEIEETPAPASIDWSTESRLAASRQIESLEDARRRARGFTPLEANRDPADTPASHPKFGWSHASIHRIEAIPEGGTLVWINDRCALVVTVGLMPVCKIGKIEARGDLFEHLGDWKSRNARTLSFRFAPECAQTLLALLITPA